MAAAERHDRPVPLSDNRQWVLGIEASTPASSVALADLQGRLAAYRWSDSPLQASQRILSDLDRLVREFAIVPGEIRAIVVAQGPGTFTGLRVALAQAKTLAHAWGARLYGISTLEAAARRWPVAGEVVCVALDARRGEVYSGIYRMRGQARPEALRPDAVESVASLLEALRAGDWPVLRLTGSGARRYRSELEHGLGARAQWIAPPLDDPAADVLALAGVDALHADEPGLDPLNAGPVYLRASDAERRHGIDLSAAAPGQVRP